MIAIQDKVISTNDYIKNILKAPKTTNDTCKKCRQKSATIQHITGAWRGRARGDYTHRHNQAIKIIL
jgi:hypothetical protein